MILRKMNLLMKNRYACWKIQWLFENIDGSKLKVLGWQ